LHAKDAVFLDDHEINVAAARGAGLHTVVFKDEAGAAVLCQMLSIKANRQSLIFAFLLWLAFAVSIITGILSGLTPRLRRPP
jgi:hypothetical protein